MNMSAGWRKANNRIFAPTYGMSCRSFFVPRIGCQALPAGCQAPAVKPFAGGIEHECQAPSRACQTLKPECQALQIGASRN